MMERMKENLKRFLETQRGKLNLPEQIRISHEVTQGVAFLHQLTPPMVHRDLNDKNVMFTFDGVVKIGDFGQSKLKTGFYLKTTAPGMVSFMPPEALCSGNAKYDESLDVFSLGVLMLSIGTQHPPSSDLTGICVIPEFERRAKDLERMSDSHPMKPFILLCLIEGPKKRPKAAELEMELQKLDMVSMMNDVMYMYYCTQSFHIRISLWTMGHRITESPPFFSSSTYECIYENLHYIIMVAQGAFGR